MNRIVCAILSKTGKDYETCSFYLEIEVVYSNKTIVISIHFPNQITYMKILE